MSSSRAAAAALGGGVTVELGSLEQDDSVSGDKTPIATPRQPIEAGSTYALLRAGVANIRNFP
ncbi:MULTISPECIES: hypothetical protein [unclassified Bradyrhizobium]|uniref:hypothetical protein n=1 Tax=unclassified Bradyrhizobium TaxID=2631580 RepID=UPI002916FEE6|nr:MULTISPECIES: hypothetical protein [unclassified Bradyrhizobium]